MDNKVITAKKHFEHASIKFIEFRPEDIITASGGGFDGDWDPLGGANTNVDIEMPKINF